MIPPVFEVYRGGDLGELVGVYTAALASEIATREAAVTGRPHLIVEVSRRALDMVEPLPPPPPPPPPDHLLYLNPAAPPPPRTSVIGKAGFGGRLDEVGPLERAE